MEETAPESKIKENFRTQKISKKGHILQKNKQEFQCLKIPAYTLYENKTIKSKM